MPYSTNWEERGVYRKYTGLIVARDILDAAEEVTGDLRYDDLLYVINDFSVVDNIQLSEEDLALIKAIDNATAITNSRCKLAIVCRNEHQPLAEQYINAMGKNGFDTQIFETPGQARCWIET